MDLQQRKLTKSEWESIETPVAPNEKEILKLIVDGYNDVNIKYNNTNSILSYLKVEFNELLENYIYNKFFAAKIATLYTLYNVDLLKIKPLSTASLKKSYIMRIQRCTPETIKDIVVYENILIEQIELLFKNKNKHKNNINWEINYLTLYKLIKNNVTNINIHIIRIIKNILDSYKDEIDYERIITNGSEYIEKNTSLLKYKDMTLYEHQKKVFTLCKEIQSSKLILYIAPTGTGKTLTPLGLLGHHKIIFVCAARHVGLALAKASISISKKVAFAFGCDTADDIRLHYFAAKDYTTNWKSGGIWKVDNSVGDKVEIMICDIKSYLPAMYYMLSFNDKQNIITYWDEPTITLDYLEHDFHSIIQKNWNENLIPNIILSSATLPKEEELPDTISSFREKFAELNPHIHSIVSHECHKSIPILNKQGYVMLPHYLSSDYKNILKITNHCENYKTLLRYFDLKEVCNFIIYINENNYMKPNTTISRYFQSLDDISMENIKLYYLRLLKSIIEDKWGGIYTYLYSKRQKHIVEQDVTSKPKNDTFGTYITTNDAYTLTDGPTIYLANDVQKIAKFCIQEANIPAAVMTDILGSIEYNNRVNEHIEKLQKNLEDSLPKENEKDDKGKKGTKTKKVDRIMNTSSQSVKINKEIDAYQTMIKVAQLNDTFIPNKLAHLKKWCGDATKIKNAFSSSIDEDTIVKIMMLSDVSNSWKILLMMGIGVFTNHKSIDYTEIMKNLAEQQKLYLIIASSDYIYGTNYQFCHGYISKDMALTQEKIIQSMGRIGRNNLQQSYTIRMRNDELINKLFTPDADKPEVVNMNRLFNTSEITHTHIFEGFA